MSVFVRKRSQFSLLLAVLPLLLFFVWRWVWVDVDDVKEAALRSDMSRSQGTHFISCNDMTKIGNLDDRFMMRFAGDRHVLKTSDFALGRMLQGRGPARSVHWVGSVRRTGFKQFDVNVGSFVRAKDHLGGVTCSRLYRVVYRNGGPVVLPGTEGICSDTGRLMLNM